MFIGKVFNHFIWEIHMDEIFDMIKKELIREEETINLIASENYPSKQVLDALGSVLNNKYAEGYPGRRYYGGTWVVDEVESLAIKRAKKLFGVDHANVQPHAGAIANLSAYMAFLKPGDKIMGLTLNNGGHLTHGMRINYSGIFYKTAFYSLNEYGLLDYDLILKRAKEEKPNLIITGYSAYSRYIDFKQFREIADEVDAYLLADISHISGLVAAGVHPSPVRYADVITSTTHKTLRGPRGAIIMTKEEFARNVDRAVFPGVQGGPMEHVIAAKAICFNEAMQPQFKEYAKQIVKNTRVMVEQFKELGYNIVSGGSDNHLFLIDLRNKHISGKEAQEKLEKNGIVLNMNAIPFDTAKPSNPSGIRIGTPAITTRGMKEDEARYIVKLIDKVLTKNENVKEEVEELCKEFRVYLNT